MPQVHQLRLLVPEVAAAAQPGQFVHVRCGAGLDPLLRRPLSVHRYDRENGRVELLFARIGRGTALLAQARPGEILDVLGPLGRGFRVEARTRNILLVAGGLGIAPLVALADEAIRREMMVTMIAGSKSAAAVPPASLMSPEVEYVICTEDGSLGEKGLVTECVPHFAEWADQTFACGPREMLRALARLPSLPRKSVQVSLEEHMGCGLGACFGCVVRTKNGFQRVCRDGPVFDIEDVVWE